MEVLGKWGQELRPKAEKDKTERATRTREVYESGIKLTALRFQTGGRHQNYQSPFRGHFWKVGRGIHGQKQKKEKTEGATGLGSITREQTEKSKQMIPQIPDRGETSQMPGLLFHDESGWTTKSRGMRPMMHQAWTTKSRGMRPMMHQAEQQGHVGWDPWCIRLNNKVTWDETHDASGLHNKITGDETHFLQTDGSCLRFG